MAKSNKKGMWSALSSAVQSVCRSVDEYAQAVEESGRIAKEAVQDYGIEISLENYENDAHAKKLINERKNQILKARGLA